MQRLCGPGNYISLIAETGERTDLTADEIVTFWHDGDEVLKVGILEAVNELHCTKVASILIRLLDREENPLLTLKILDTVVSVADFADVIGLPAHFGPDNPVPYYHSIDLVYRRLIANPIHLERLPDFSLLRHFELGRASIYDDYRCVFGLLELITCLDEVMKRVEAGGEGREVALLPMLGLSLSGETRHGLLSGPGAARMRTLLSRIDKLHAHCESHHDRFDRICRLLHTACHFNPRYSDDIFGRTTSRFMESRVLCLGDLSGTASDGVAAVRDWLRVLREKTESSVTLMQEFFLFKEWFVRRAPFVLREDFTETIACIRSGGDLIFDPEFLEPDAARQQMARDVQIQRECIRQGVYLTDVLLDFLRTADAARLPEVIQRELTHRRSQIALAEIAYEPEVPFDRHLVFTTFAHTYRYGKESIEQPSITYLWLRYLEAVGHLRAKRTRGRWPRLPRHPEAQKIVGPLVKRVYRQQRRDAQTFHAFVDGLYKRFHPQGIRIRVIPNIAYGLFCVGPVLMDMIRNGIHVSLAGMSSRYCDDSNISEFSLGRGCLYPVKPYLFSTASNYGTLNHDRILVVVDGTMEPVDRMDPGRIRLPKAHRGYLDHVVAVNYVRARYGYGMHEPERDVASALHLPVRYVYNLLHTVDCKRLVDNLLLSFDVSELERFQRANKTGRTYYSFAQWNPDGMGAWIGPRGYQPVDLPCITVQQAGCPCLVFASINGFRDEGAIPAFFDNRPEVEKPRIILGPDGAKLDTGWPHEGRGVVVRFPEGENR